MVYTVTLNPALDHIVFVSELKAGALNVMDKEIFEVGGNGIGVSVVLSELDVRSKALGFVAGFTGDEIERRLHERGVETDFIRLDSGNSRVNMKIKNYSADGVTETEINSESPDVSDEALAEFFTKLGVIENGDVLVLGGSVPKNLKTDIYEHILEYIAGKDVKVAVDARGGLLISALKYKPFLIKPNMDELGEIFGERPSSMLEAIAYAKHLQEMGARNILVSMAADGAVLLDESGKTFFCKACSGKVRNSVGAGDAMLAGFLSGALDSDTDMEYALMLGNAAGGAAAFSDGFPRKAAILDLMKILLKEHAEKPV